MNKLVENSIQEYLKTRMEDMGGAFMGGLSVGGLSVGGRRKVGRPRKHTKKHTLKHRIKHSRESMGHGEGMISHQAAHKRALKAWRTRHEHMGIGEGMISHEAAHKRAMKAVRTKRMKNELHSEAMKGWVTRRKKGYGCGEGAGGFISTLVTALPAVVSGVKGLINLVKSRKGKGEGAFMGGRKRKSTGSRGHSSWIKYVKQFARENDIDYHEALSRAGPSYHASYGSSY